MARIPDDRLRIFVSHKHTDAELANVVQSQIEGLSPMFECFVSGQGISSGTDWNRAITVALGRSHVLLLLFTAPASNWDWCLYEAGLFIQFANAADEDIRSVVPIFDPATGPPRPLAGVQGAPAEARSIAKLLTKLCHTPWEVCDDWRRGAVDATVEPAAIDSAAAAIATAFRTAIEAERVQPSNVLYPCHRLVLEATLSEDEDLRIPDEARILTMPNTTTAYTLSLFGLAAGEAPHNWGELLDRIDGHDEPWRVELDQALAATFREELFVPGSATMRAWDRGSAAGRTYRVVLYSVSRRGGDGAVEIVILLDPMPALAKVKGAAT